MMRRCRALSGRSLSVTRALAFLMGLLITAPHTALSAPSSEVCIFRTTDGKIVQVNSRGEVPSQYRDHSQCFSPKQNSDYLAAPDEVKIDSLKRVEEFKTSIGNVWLSWPRKVESLFGRTPLRAVTDAMNTVSRAVKNGAFPSSIQTLRADWKIIFLDESLPEQQIPRNLISGCHPGWMTPPANIYIVAQRVAEGCGGLRKSASVADSMLARVLIHEMGHAVEYRMLEEKMGGDRMRAEGFASWFEEYASAFSSVVNKREITQEHRTLAKIAIQTNPNEFQFTGTADDYARASLYFSAIEAARGLPGVMELYEALAKDAPTFDDAVKSGLGWDTRRLNKEVEKLVK